MASRHEEHRYGFGTTLVMPVDEAVTHTTEALKREGFGVLTTIDVRQTLQNTLGVDFKPYVILGARNPQLAYRALQAEPALGLLLPGNVIVHEHDGACVVSVVDPAKMLGVAGDNPELQTVAVEAEERLRRIMASLEDASDTYSWDVRHGSSGRGACSQVPAAHCRRHGSPRRPSC